MKGKVFQLFAGAMLFSETQVRVRAWILASVGTLAFALLAVRLCWVCLWPPQVLLFEHHEHERAGLPLGFRADIVDRNGVVLATSVKTFSVYACPRRLENIQDAAVSLGNLFRIPVKELLTLFRSKRKFVWIARHVTPDERLRVRALGLKGVDLLEDYRRVYPHGHLFSHALGLTDIDQVGTCGLEKAFHHSLYHKTKPIAVALDIRLQHILYHELHHLISSYRAEGGNAILVNVRNGEILAMVSLPDFAPHEAYDVRSKAFFNRNVNGVYEFGSMLKIHNIASALECSATRLHTRYDISEPLRVGRFKVTDFQRKLNNVTTEEAFLYSSNIANAKIAMDMGSDRQIEFFQKMGFSYPVHTELKEEARPLFPKKWGKAQNITAAYGYGFAITPLHLVRSVGAIVTGILRKLTFCKTGVRETPGKVVVSRQTSLAMRRLLELATIQGQAKKAAVEGYAIGAKTGTANMRSQGKRYKQKENLTSCVAVFPVHDPHYVLLISVEKPQASAATAGFATAGWIVAPAVSSVIRQSALTLGILPQMAPSSEKPGKPKDHLECVQSGGCAGAPLRAN